MAYLGRGLDKISNIEVLDNITFDGSSSYSITKNSVAFVVNSAQSCLLSIDGVVQAGNFTVNGSTIDFGVAVPSTSVCNFFLHYGTGVMTVPSDGSVTTAKLGNSAVDLTSKVTGTLPVANGGTNLTSGFANGITMADQWRLTAGVNSGVSGDVTSNWERNDNASYSSIGTGLTESSGVFSFPSTGIYLIIATAAFSITSSDQTATCQLVTTIDNSTYPTALDIRGGNTSTSTTARENGCGSYIFDVTDISLCKFKFITDSFTNGTFLDGNTGQNRTHFTVIRLGDT
jgi:hypothetical protein